MLWIIFDRMDLNENLIIKIVDGFSVPGSFPHQTFCIEGNCNRSCTININNSFWTGSVHVRQCARQSQILGLGFSHFSVHYLCLCFSGALQLLLLTMKCTHCASYSLRKKKTQAHNHWDDVRHGELMGKISQSLVCMGKISHFHRHFFWVVSMQLVETTTELWQRLFRDFLFTGTWVI